MEDNSSYSDISQYADLSQRRIHRDDDGRPITRDGFVIGDDGFIDYSQESGSDGATSVMLPEFSYLKDSLGTKRGRSRSTHIAIGAFGGKIIQAVGKAASKGVGAVANFAGQHSSEAGAAIGKTAPRAQEGAENLTKKGLAKLKRETEGDLSRQIDPDAVKKGFVRGQPSEEGDSSQSREPGTDIVLAQGNEIARQDQFNKELERRSDPDTSVESYRGPGQSAQGGGDIPRSSGSEPKTEYIKPPRGKEAAKNAWKRHGEDDHRFITERAGDALRDGTGIDIEKTASAFGPWGAFVAVAWGVFNRRARNIKAFTNKVTKRAKYGFVASCCVFALIGIYVVTISTVSGTSPAAANTVACIPDPDQGERPDGADTGNGDGDDGGGDDGDHNEGAGTSADSLNQHQKGVAAVIMAMGDSLGISEYGQIIAIMTAMQESHLGAAAGSNKPNGDGDAGPFQQRQLPGWYGTLDEVTNPAYASKVFYQGKTVTEGGGAGPKGYHIPGLLDIDGWEDLQAAQAAQKVQRSAFPDAYAKWEAFARDVYRKMGGDESLIPDEYKEAIENPDILDNGVKGGDDDSKDDSDSGDDNNDSGGNNGGNNGTDNTNNPIACGPDAKEDGGGSGNACPTRASDAVESALEGVKPDTLNVARCVWGQNNKLNSMGGIGSRPNKSDHGSGRAVDVMIPDWKDTSKTGDEIATYVMECAADLGVTYIIWDVRIWNRERGEKPKDVKEWRDYTHPNGNSNPTVRHEDHVHVSVEGNSGSTSCGDDDGGGASGDWVLPVKKGNYALTSPFGERVHPITGERKMHAGQDMGARPRGTNPQVVSATKGKVTYAGVQGGYGNTVVVDVGDNTEIYYPHLQSIQAEKGDTLKAGDKVGKMGTTGASTGVHLHFEVRVKGDPVDPVPYMSKRGVKL